MALAAVGASIEHLLLPSRPTAVARFVIAFVVDPIQREAVRTRAHVGEKVLEAMPPAAHGDPAPAVSRPVGARWVRAPAQHALPGVIRAGASACCLSVASRHTRIKAKRRAPSTDDRGLGRSCQRETGLEPATSTLGRLHSTVELLPRDLRSRLERFLLKSEVVALLPTGQGKARRGGNGRPANRSGSPMRRALARASI
jgi:hypothetical protein